MELIQIPSKLRVRPSQPEATGCLGLPVSGVPKNLSPTLKILHKRGGFKFSYSVARQPKVPSILRVVSIPRCFHVLWFSLMHRGFSLAFPLVFHTSCATSSSLDLTLVQSLFSGLRVSDSISCVRLAE